MAIKTQSQAIKNQGSALRRTATAVRNLASSLHDPKSIQTLLAAATVIDAEAASTMQRARQKLDDERQFEAAMKKALPIARQLVSTLPMATTAEKLAVMSEGFNCGYMISTIRGEYPHIKATPERLQRELDDALNEIANDLASVSARTGNPPEISELFLVRLQRYAKNPEIAEAAALFDSMNAKEAA